jgi:NAD(P)-dependent dehydrogenase (short-subunit alcohol dehydrogenase family)
MTKINAIVTGASKGIGSAIAIKLKDNGYNVIGTSTTGYGTCKGVDQWKMANFNTLDGVKFFLDEINNISNVRILINNAAINIIKPQIEVDIADLERITNINLYAPYLISRYFAEKMSKQGGGRIINIASIWSVITKSNRTLYSTMKSGLAGMTRAMAVEWADKNVIINCVSPGFVNTELTKASLNVNETDKLLKEIPMRRFAEPNEIANLVSYLSSEENTYLTGQNIIIDGGFTIV